MSSGCLIMNSAGMVSSTIVNGELVYGNLDDAAIVLYSNHCAVTVFRTYILCGIKSSAEGCSPSLFVPSNLSWVDFTLEFASYQHHK